MVPTFDPISARRRSHRPADAGRDVFPEAGRGALCCGAADFGAAGCDQKIASPEDTVELVGEDGF